MVCVEINHIKMLILEKRQVDNDVRDIVLIFVDLKLCFVLSFDWCIACSFYLAILFFGCTILKHLHVGWVIKCPVSSNTLHGLWINFLFVARIDEFSEFFIRESLYLVLFKEVLLTTNKYLTVVFIERFKVINKTFIKLIFFRVFTKAECSQKISNSLVKHKDHKQDNRRTIISHMEWVSLA